VGGDDAHTPDSIIHIVQQHYDKSSFDCMSDSVLEEVRNHTLLGEVERYFDPGQWQRVIDVGCGASARNPFFVQRYWGQDTVAVDLSWRTLQKAQKRIAVPFVNGNVLALPFPDEVFDFAMSTGVIHHTPDPHHALRELKRIVRPGGGMFVSVYNRRSIYYPTYRYLGRMFQALVRWGLEPLVRWVFVPLYAVAYAPIVWIALKRIAPVPYRQAAADFDDKFLNPYVLFYLLEEVEAWIAAEGLTCLRSGTHMASMMLGFLVKK
jgi:ubiquinone/menaquinone biosynthesis C-methylase UbiE